jgi:hypothetical protein
MQPRPRSRRIGAVVLHAAFLAGVVGVAAITSPGSSAAQTAAGPCTPGPRAVPDPNRSTYTVGVTADPVTGAVTGEMTVRFTPDQDTDRLVFRQWANSPRSGAVATMGAVQLDGGRTVASTKSPDPTTTEVRLSEPLRSGQSIVASTTFTLTVTGQTDGRWSRGSGTMRIGNFIPVLPWERGRGWNTTAPTVARGEASMNPIADYTLTVATDPKLTVLASGALSPRTGAGDRWQFVAPAVRDVGLSIGAFRTATAVVNAPGSDPITVTVGIAPTISERPQAYLARITTALEKMATLYGPAPYPWLSVALTPGLRGGIEFPGHIMQGPNSIGRTTPHEVAHQWFYALVGNDQGRDPWIDEGLATWAEGRLERTTGAFVAKDIPAVGQGKTGRPMSYWNANGAAYYRSVYVQTVQLLDSFDDPVGVDCALRRLVERHAYGVVTAADVIAVFETQFPGATARFAKFGVS